MSSAISLKAVLWDFGGVFSSSPFEAFARYERERGLPEGFVRSVNTLNPDTNAWARLERSEIDAAVFDAAFEAESRALGHAVRGRDILPLLFGEIRPSMVAALRTCKAGGFKVGCITNNVGDLGPAVVSPDRAAGWLAVTALFDTVIESSRAGVRKPEPAIYRMACDALSIAPEEAVYLDDLGINLKPARAMGMRTIKVDDPDAALRELAGLTGLRLQ